VNLTLVFVLFWSSLSFYQRTFRRISRVRICRCATGFGDDYSHVRGLCGRRVIPFVFSHDYEVGEEWRRCHQEETWKAINKQNKTSQTFVFHETDNIISGLSSFPLEYCIQNLSYAAAYVDISISSGSSGMFTSNLLWTLLRISLSWSLDTNDTAIPLVPKRPARPTRWRNWSLSSGKS